MPELVTREGAAGIFVLEDDIPPNDSDAWLYISKDAVVSVEEMV
jgi:hypothetical protein